MRKPDKSVESVTDSDFFLPDLCTPNSILYLVIVVELLVLVLVLADTGINYFSWKNLGLWSLYIQWISLCSAGILCRLRSVLGGMGDYAATVLAVAVVLTVTLVFGLAADRLLNSAELVAPDIDWLTISRNLLISLIMTGLVFRYLYLQQQLLLQKQAELNSRVQALQSRIRPHFLFNSMNIIASLIAVDPDLAEEVVEDLSALFRASLRDSHGHAVKLADELSLCERYIKIESLRMDDRLSVEWDIQVDTDLVQIPLLTLQPLLENAIYHGIQPLPEGGTIRVSATAKGKEVIIRVSNPLPEREADLRKGNRMALENIRLRLEAIHGSQAKVENAVIEDRFEIILRFPMSFTWNDETA